MKQTNEPTGVKAREKAPEQIVRGSGLVEANILLNKRKQTKMENKISLNCANNWANNGDEEYKTKAAIKLAAKEEAREIMSNFSNMYCSNFRLGQLKYSNGTETPKVPKFVNMYITKNLYYREETINEVRKIDNEDKIVTYTKYVPATMAEATMSRIEKFPKVYGVEYKNRIARTRILFRKALENHYRSALAQVRDIRALGAEEFPGEEVGTYVVPYILVQVVKGKRGNEPTVELKSVSLDRFNKIVNDAENKIYAFFDELDEYQQAHELKLKHQNTNALKLVQTQPDEEIKYELNDISPFLKYEVNKKTGKYSDNLVIGQMYNKYINKNMVKCKVCGTEIEVTPRVMFDYDSGHNLGDQEVISKPQCICDECFGTDISLIELKDETGTNMGYTEVDTDYTDEEKIAIRRDRGNLSHDRKYEHLCKTIEQFDCSLKDIKIVQVKLVTDKLTGEQHISVRIVLKNEEGDEVTRWQKLKYYMNEYLEIYGEAAKILYDECYVALTNGVDLETFNWIVDSYLEAIKQTKKMVTIPRSIYKGFVSVKEYELKRIAFSEQSEAVRQQYNKKQSKNFRKTLYKSEEVEVEKILNKRGEWSCTKFTLLDGEKKVKYILNLNQKAMANNTVTTKDETGTISFKVDRWLMNKAEVVSLTPMEESIGVNEQKKSKLEVFDVRARYSCDFKEVTTKSGKTVAKYLPNEEIPKKYKTDKYSIGVIGIECIKENKITCICGCNKLIKDTFNGVLICSKCGLEQEIQTKFTEPKLNIEFRKESKPLVEETKDKQNYELWYFRNFGVMPVMTVE